MKTQYKPPKKVVHTGLILSVILGLSLRLAVPTMNFLRQFSQVLSLKPSTMRLTVRSCMIRVFLRGRLASTMQPLCSHYVSLSRLYDSVWFHYAAQCRAQYAARGATMSSLWRCVRPLWFSITQWRATNPSSIALSMDPVRIRMWPLQKSLKNRITFFPHYARSNSYYGRSMAFTMAPCVRPLWSLCNLILVSFLVLFGINLPKYRINS